MDGLAIRTMAARPTDRWQIPERLLKSLDFAQQAAAIFDSIAMDAVVAFDLGVTASGDFVDARTGFPDPAMAAKYSQMKYGDLDAVAFFAGHLAASAMRCERFLARLRDAATTGQVAYLTTAAVFNAPSASNLLLRSTAAHLNILLARQGLAPVVVVELTRLSESPLGYESKTARERRDELVSGRGVTIVPEYFRGEFVIYLDDLFSTGYSIWRAEHRLRKIGVAASFYLLAARMDPHAVGASHGQIEDRLNDLIIAGTLQNLVPMLTGGNFAVVQKLVKATLDPDHAEQLPTFLEAIPTASILKIYAAAASDGFRQRNRSRYLPSLLMLENALETRGAVDAEGHIAGAPVDLAALS